MTFPVFIIVGCFIGVVIKEEVIGGVLVCAQ